MTFIQRLLTARRRRQLSWVGAAAACVFAAAGCGQEQGPSELADTYDVVKHTRNADGCDAEGDRVAGSDEFFKLTDDGDRLSYHACDAADTCSETVSETLSFEIEDGDRWIGEVINNDRRRGSCIVRYTERIIRPDGASVHIDTHTYEGEVARDEGVECDDAFARQNRDRLSCSQYELVVAVPVAQ